MNKDEKTFILPGGTRALPDGTHFGASGQPSFTATILKPIESVGSYDLGNVFLMVTKRPSWFQRVMVRWCFGWKWRNK